MQNYYLLVAKRLDGSIFAPVKCKVLTGCRPLTKPFAYQWLYMGATIKSLEHSGLSKRYWFQVKYFKFVGLVKKIERNLPVMNINKVYRVVVQAQFWTTMNTGDNHELQNVINFGGLLSSEQWGEIRGFICNDSHHYSHYFKIEKN